MSIKVATVCSGIGSPEQALKDIGIDHEIVFACEKDKYARQTYLANFKPNQMFEDMTTQDWSGDHMYSDLFVGGIPCQSFSLAGKRMGINDARGLLFYNFYDYVKIQRPKYFIIENVKGLLSDARGRTFQSWLELLGSSVNYQYNMIDHEDCLGYNLHWTVLNSKNFGVPQNRERVFLIGIRPDLPNDFRFPLGEPLVNKLKDVLETNVDEKYYLSDKMLGWMQEHSNKKAAEGCGFNFSPKDVNGISNAINARTFKMGIDDNYIEDVDPKIIGYTRDSKGIVTDRHIKDEAGTVHTATGGGGNTDQFVLEANSKDNGIYKITCNCGQTFIGRLHDKCPTCNNICDGYANELTYKEHLKLARLAISAGRIIGRNPENPKSRVAGLPTEQMIEVNEDPDITNTLTTVQKDNCIVENKVFKLKDIRPMDEYLGAKIWVPPFQKNFEPYVIQLSEQRKYGKITAKSVGTTLLAGTQKGDNEALVVVNNTTTRIRRLTPLECFRLQGYPDSFIKPVSDTQLYKQAGNTITTTVLKAIFKPLLKHPNSDPCS